MFEFKEWLLSEIVELKRPTNKVVKKNIVRDKGTNVARPMIQYQWRTALGNDVKLQLTKEWDSYAVVFYVNDVLDDYGSHTGDWTRDPEVLSSVFYVLKQKAKKLNIQKMYFNAWKSPNDTKIVRNIPLEPLKQRLMADLKAFAHAIKDYEVKFKQPSENLNKIYKDMGFEIPAQGIPDIDKQKWLQWCGGLKMAVDKQEDLDSYYDDLLSAQGIGKFSRINVGGLPESLKQLKNAFESHTERGFSNYRNRRAAIYERLVNRYFSNDYKIDINGDKFTLEKIEL